LVAALNERVPKEHFAESSAGPDRDGGILLSTPGSPARAAAADRHHAFRWAPACDTPARLTVAAIALCLCTAAAAGAGPRAVTEKRHQAVEVAPGRFLTLSRVDVPGASRFVDGTRDEATEMVIPWDGREVRWKGLDIPVSLRESDGRLHLITFDRQAGVDGVRLRYYRQGDGGDRFHEIDPAKLPKRIATQNMWMGKPDEFSRGTDGRRIYAVDLALKLDPDDVSFADTLTAAIWCQLHAGLDYRASKRLPLERR
jgi:hypothetical protein